MGFWSRAPPALTQEYQESVAHRVRDILTGESHTSHTNAIRDKQALKALQRPEALAGVIEILKSMPDPDHERAEGWEVDEGVDIESEQEEVTVATAAEAVESDKEDKEDKDRNMKHAAAATAAVAVAATAAIVAAKASSSPASPSESGSASRAGAGTSSTTALSSAAPKGTTIVAATTIAAAAATSAVAATLAVTLRGPRKKGGATGDSKVVENEDNSVTTTTTKTVVRFHPSKDTVSSQAYWWGYEIFIPQVALSRISSAQDVSSAFLGFLGSVGLVVPAIVPFLGYIAAYVGLEFAVIKAQNEGRGVILASTWLVPVALVPRAWDVPEEEGVDGTSGRA
ncbi:hypothetical protein BG015_000537 [Linnemannia schmuckeri]|uniref:Uncharacterized protein n=1 Tax=Linnemannia schmuckeri TaxID=64567 RepID=A0A9P5RRE7_9FUNG|nr:hypothetical protein BG015_000537 [Linnemannia schmuckeri]